MRFDRLFGLEAGQLMFIVVVLVAIKLVLMLVFVPSPMRLAGAYAIGTISSYWFISRLSSF